MNTSTKLASRVAFMLRCMPVELACAVEKLVRFECDHHIQPDAERPRLLIGNILIYDNNRHRLEGQLLAAAWRGRWPRQ